MTKEDKRYSEPIVCGHCFNVAPMEQLYHHWEHMNGEPPYETEKCHEILICPSCRKMVIRNYIWTEVYSDPTDVEYEYVYPLLPQIPVGLPSHISKQLVDAIRIKNRDSNAYGVLIGRVIELTCKDKGAMGRFLHNKLEDLSKKGEIPERLFKIAKNLKDIRNIGAHPDLGELTQEEVPIIENLCRALFEYVYSAPYLAMKAEENLAEIKNRKTIHSSPATSNDTNWDT